MEGREPTREQWQRIRSIAEQALDLGPAEQDALLLRECAGEPAIERAVRRILELDRSPNPGLDRATSGIAGHATAHRIGPYTLRRELGSGGMGSVWLAMQSEGDFHRRVAIKLLQRGIEKEEILARFQRERQVLANLDHPGIARLIDGGVSEQGEPYIVMEYVEGIRIDRWCDEHRLSPNARLDLFLEVCDAVQHAHQRLVVHRDLKPSNILVTDDGNPKLLDFGIAKVLDPEKLALGAEVTRGVMRYFTPSYASPEQARGLSVTTVSDVYSLGVLLYLLLTGRLPHRHEDSSSEELARVLAEVEPEKPSTAVLQPTPEVVGNRRSTTARQLSRFLAGDLDRILLKALRPEPLRRYPTVHEFAEDIRRYRRGLPVSARTDSAAYRASRFVRRNKIAVSLAALLLVSLCTGIVLLSWQNRATGRARVEERDQRRLAQSRLLELERIQGELATRNALLEEHIEEGRELATSLGQARAIAESRFEDVRRFTTTLLFDLYARVYALEGATDATGLLLSTGVEYLDRLAEESSSDPELARELAAAYLQLADLQAGLYHANLGRTEEAAASLEKATAMAAAASRGEELLAPERALHSRIRITGGDLARRSERAEQALDEYLRAVEWLEPFEHDDGATTQHRYGLSTALSRVAEWLHERGSLTESREYYSRAQLLLERLLSKEPDTWFLGNDVSIVQGRLAAIGMDLGEREEALSLAHRSLELADAVAAANPGVFYTQRQSMQARFQLAEMLEAEGDEARARALFARAMELAQKLSAADPRNVLAQRDVLIVHLHAAGVEIRAENWGAALPLCEQALTPALAAAARDPGAWLAQLELAQVYVELGRIKLELDADLEAGSDLGQARAILEKMSSIPETEIVWRRYFAQTAHALGSVLSAHAEQHESKHEIARGLASARTWLERAEVLFRSFQDLGHALPMDEQDLVRVREQIDRCRAAEAAGSASDEGADS